MCGIQAVFSKKLPRKIQTIFEAGQNLHLRGPDSGCIHLNQGVYTFRRLAINDKSIYGNQPFISDSILVMCNGEIYNHTQLKKEYEIPDSELKSHSDCEILIPLYKKIGFLNMLSVLDGVFAIVLVDGDNVWFARDRIGVRPLFVGRTEDEWFAVGSTAKSILPFCSNVSQVYPGTAYYHRKGDSSMTKHSYIGGSLPMILPGFYHAPQNQLRGILSRAVKKRLLSDRPIGCLLSGGLDSSIIAALLVRHLGAENVRTYSIGMEGSTDLFYATQVAEFLGTKHTTVKFTPEEGFNAIPDVVYALESYDITTIRASVGMYLLSKYISEHTDDIVIFSGEGADELFCGYLYWHNSPSVQDSAEESRYLTRNLYKYDVLRADRVVSCHGLELRVPFLDKYVVDFAFQIDPELKVPKNGVEKYLLRKTFASYLPECIRDRQKVAFSDGVSGVQKSWYECIQEKINKTGFVWDKERYLNCEDAYYRTIFTQVFPNYDLELQTWMPKWSDTNDPSARTLEMCKEKKETA